MEYDVIVVGAAPLVTWQSGKSTGLENGVH